MQNRTPGGPHARPNRAPRAIERVDAPHGRAAGAAPLAAIVVVWGVLALGCQVPVASGLDEVDANRVMLALEHGAIGASKEADPQSEGKFRVLVTRDDTAPALGILREEELPRPKPKGVLDALDHGAWVPSPGAEHAQRVAGMSGDLQHTLESVDGVVLARVHLHVPERDPLRGHEGKATASVLIEHRGATPPIAPEAVQRLVAGGVPQLSPMDVAVVAVPRAPRTAPVESQLAHIGPLSVSRGSAAILRTGLTVLTILLMGFAAGCLALYVRMTRLREAALRART